MGDYQTFLIRCTKRQKYTASVSDSETRVGRPRRRRTTGGSDVGEDVEKARRLGYASDQNGNHGRTLSRQQIVSMVKRRFGLKSESTTSGCDKANGVTEEPPPKPPLPQLPSSPKERKYQELLDNAGTYPTLPRKDENSLGTQPVSTPGVVYLQLGDEIKRAMLPSQLEQVQQVREMFRQTFPEKLQENANNRKTVYIKDSTCGVFYELDNVGDLTNKSHLKVLESAPYQNGPVSNTVTHNLSSPAAKRPVTHSTSTPLPNHSHVEPRDAVMHSRGPGNSHITTTIVTRKISGNTPSTTSRMEAGSANLMDQRKVPLHGLGTSLKPTDGKRRPGRDPMEEELDSLTDMLQQALKTGSQESLPKTQSNEGSETSSQSSFIDHGSSEGKYKCTPLPPPRGSSHAVSRDTSQKYSQTLQRTPNRGSARRELNPHYQTLPLPVSKNVKRTMSEGSATSSHSSHSSGTATVTYEGKALHMRKRAIGSKAAELKQDVLELRSQLIELRQLQSSQAQEFAGHLKAAMEQITRSVSKLIPAEGSSLSDDRENVEQEEMTYIRGKNDVNRQISELESEVEMVRLDVVQRRCVGNPMGIENLNDRLGIISRQIAELKGQFSQLHDNMKQVMAGELEIIVQGDKFLKEEPLKLENLISRCKHVTGTLFTLQKLLSAQEQMKSESHSSFSSIEEMDKEMLDNIRLMQKEYPQRGIENEDGKNGKARHRVRFFDEVTPQ